MRHGRSAHRSVLVFALAASFACGGRTLEASDDSGPHMTDPAVAAIDATTGSDAPTVAATSTADAGTTDASLGAPVDASLGAPVDASLDAGAADADPWAGLDGGGYVSDAGRCGTGVVTFQVYGGPGGPWWLIASGDEEPNGVAVFTAAGARLDQSPTEFTSVCGTCDTWPVPIGFQEGELTDAGTTQTWDGVYYVSGTNNRSCDPYPISQACMSQECAPPGKYFVEMCACGAVDPPAWNGGTPPYWVAACNNPTCVLVPFLYPSPTVVKGIVTGPPNLTVDASLVPVN